MAWDAEREQQWRTLRQAVLSGLPEGRAARRDAAAA